MRMNISRGLPKKNKENLAQSINLSLCPFTDKCKDYVDRIYIIELEIKDTTYTAKSTSYLDLHLYIDSENRLTAQRDDLKFHIVNFLFICNNIPTVPAY
jgi:hypothetical protein